jgi:hypothetical protein
MRRGLFLLLFLACMISSALAELLTEARWVARYDGPVNGVDEARAIAIDDSGNVYVTGWSDSQGDTPFNYDYVTIKYFPNGDTAWVRRYDGTSHFWDEPLAIAADSCGNSYITGLSTGLGSDIDCLTIKYWSNGDTAWIRRYDGPMSGWDQGSDIAVDHAGFVYVVGFSDHDFDYPFGATADYLILKYYPNGDTAWLREYDGPGNYEDWGNDIALDGAGNVCITGQSTGSLDNFDYCTIKYDADGNQLWVRRYAGSSNGSDIAIAIETDKSGNTIVTGWAFEGETGNDYVTIKYRPNGDTAWIRAYNGPENGSDLAYAMAVDDYGNIYVTGASYGGETGLDYATVKYSSDGEEMWVQRYHNYGVGEDVAVGLTLDDSRFVHITGRSIGSGTNLDYATIKYDSSGNRFWVRRYLGTGYSGNDEAQAIAVDDSGHVYVTGASDGIWRDFSTIKYVETGRWRGDANGDGIIDGGDIVFLLNYLFRDGPLPDPVQAGDNNCTCGQIDTGDVIFLLSYLYRGWHAPECPW